MASFKNIRFHWIPFIFSVTPKLQTYQGMERGNGRSCRF